MKKTTLNAADPCDVMKFAADLFHRARQCPLGTRFTVTVIETDKDESAQAVALAFGSFGQQAEEVELITEPGTETRPYLPPYRVSGPIGGNYATPSRFDNAAINHPHLEPEDRSDVAGNEVPA